MGSLRCYPLAAIQGEANRHRRLSNDGKVSMSSKMHAYRRFAVSHPVTSHSAVGHNISNRVRQGLRVWLNAFILFTTGDQGSHRAVLEQSAARDGSAAPAVINK